MFSVTLGTSAKPSPLSRVGPHRQCYPVVFYPDLTSPTLRDVYKSGVEFGTCGAFRSTYIFTGNVALKVLSLINRTCGITPTSPLIGDSRQWVVDKNLNSLKLNAQIDSQQFNSNLCRIHSSFSFVWDECGTFYKNSRQRLLSFIFKGKAYFGTICYDLAVFDLHI